MVESIITAQLFNIPVHRQIYKIVSRNNFITLGLIGYAVVDVYTFHQSLVREHLSILHSLYYDGALINLHNALFKLRNTVNRFFTHFAIENNKFGHCRSTKTV